MDNDTKKILLLIARALQSSASVELAKIGGLGIAKEAIAEDVLVTRDLLAKINNEEKQRQAAEKYMDEIYRKGEEAVEKRKEEIRRKVGNEENNNA
jgi:hypothetical protein